MMPIRRLTTIFTALALAAALPSQPTPTKRTPTQDELKQLRTDKLAKPVFRFAPWETDYDAARAAAKKSGKVIFAYFTRSYAG